VELQAVQGYIKYLDWQLNT